MSARRYHIEIEVDNLDGKDREDAVTEAIKIMARQGYVSVMFIVGENPKPQIVVWAESMESGRSHVSLKEEEDQ